MPCAEATASGCCGRAVSAADRPGRLPGRLLALAEIPVASDVKAHSIIAIKGDAQPPAGGDGVVKYVSAHVDCAESEFLVRSGHSCQSNPATIEEVRRILLEHLKATTGGAHP